MNGSALTGVCALRSAAQAAELMSAFERGCCQALPAPLKCTRVQCGCVSKAAREPGMGTRRSLEAAIIRCTVYIVCLCQPKKLSVLMDAYLH